MSVALANSSSGSILSDLAPSKIRLEHVSVNFTGRRGTVEALSGVDLAVRRGGVVSLVGAAGGGGRSLLDGIAGPAAADEGDGVDDGEPLAGTVAHSAGTVRSAAQF